MRLLIAEGDEHRRQTLRHVLETANYLIDTVADSHDALTFAETGEYDGLVLGVSLAGCDDGLHVLETLRAHGVSTPTLLLSVGADTAICVQGLDAGADDYLSHPFSTSELLARVRAMLRRQGTYMPEQLEAFGLTLDRATFALTCSGQQIALSAKEFQIMEGFMRHPATIISADRFLTHIWGWESEVSVNVLWVHISNIRKKLSALQAPCGIRFIRGAGYIFEAREP